MKKLFIILTVALALPLLCSAQNPVPAKTYPLTNSLFSIAGGALAIPGSGSTNLNLPAFPIWRARGFALHTGLFGTNAGTDNLTYTIQTATPYTIGGVSYTNWSTAGSATATVAMNGTTEVIGYSLVAPTTMDNATLGRISSVANAHASTVWIDPTNTFISVFP